MSNFIFRLGRTTGFPNNWGCVKGIGSSSYDVYRMELQLIFDDVLFYVDGSKFTLNEAEKIAIEKAEELFGEPKIDFDSIIEQSAQPNPHKEQL